MESNDSGGVAAKHGFLFPDCLAAYHVTRMLRDKTIRSVRCEVTDDIDIVSDGYIDFVQVKSTGKTRWNISDIVQKEYQGKIPNFAYLQRTKVAKFAQTAATARDI